jgi:hypothetical protein
MKRIITFFAIACVAAGSVSAQNLLLNGDFNTAGPTGWSSWSYGPTAFASYKNPADGFAYDASPYINAGNYGDWWSSGGGWNQTVPGTAGLSYTFSSVCATEGWDNAAGEMRLIWFGAGHTELSREMLHTAEFLANQAWTPFSMTGTAPDGTVEVTVEFATWGARGSVLWDNASLSVVPEPGTLTLAGAGLALLWANSRRNRRS